MHQVTKAQKEAMKIMYPDKKAFCFNSMSAAEKRYGVYGKLKGIKQRTIDAMLKNGLIEYCDYNSVVLTEKGRSTAKFWTGD